MSYFVNKLKDLPQQEVFPGIQGRLIHTDKVTIADFRIKAGTILPAHSHPHEQTSSILAGRFEFTVGGQTRICEVGDVAVIPPNVEHSALALTDCRVLDVFEPVREDYKTANDALLITTDQPGTTYRPIDCGFYDHLEAAIVQKKRVVLVYLDAEGLHVAQRTELLDLKTERKAEFVQLPGTRWLRLDRIVSVDGVASGVDTTACGSESFR